MQELTFTRGLPASGKSTWSKKYVLENPNTIRVCRDDLRNMRGKYHLPEQEQLITLMEHSCIKSALQSGFNVIVDATNFKDSYVNAIKKLSLEINRDIKFNFKDFTEVTLDECIKRDRLRENPVGEKVIKNFYNKYLRGTYNVIRDSSLPNAIICDLDGTLAIHNGRSPYDEDKCDTDLVNEQIRTLLWQTTGSTAHLIFVSGRHDTVKEKTEKWIKEHGCPGRSFDLFMRKANDNRNDAIVKREIFMEHINGKWNVLFVLDDRNRVVDMWRNDLGLTCLQVQEGDF